MLLQNEINQIERAIQRVGALLLFYLPLLPDLFLGARSASGLAPEESVISVLKLLFTADSTRILQFFSCKLWQTPGKLTAMSLKRWESD